MKRNNKMSGYSMKSVLPKIFSVVVAIILWFYVADINTTVEEKVISGVNVDIVNFNNNDNIDIVSGRNHTIEVTVSGIKSEIEKISGKDIIASVDMNGITNPGTYSLDVYVTSPSGITVKTKTPSEISVTVDKTSSKHIAVDVNFNYKDIADDISNIGNVELSTRSVQVSGPKNEIDKIEKLVVNLEIDTITGTINSRGHQLIPVDADGNRVISPYIKLYQSVVDITIPVYKTKKVEVVPVFEDELKYTYSYSRLYPKEITIEGESAYIDSMSHVKTLPVDVNKNYQNLDLPEGITAYDENNNLIHSVLMSDIVAMPIIVTEDMEQADVE